MPDRYTLPREVSGTPPAATDLVMLVPPEDDAEPKARTLEEVGNTFADVSPRAGVVRLLYWDASETEFRFNVSGEYRFGLINLNGETIQVGQRVAIWVESNDTNATFELVDSTDLANAGGLSGPHTVTDNFVVMRATTAKSTPGYVVKMSGDVGSTQAPQQLRYIIHGAWLISSDADEIGIEALKAAVQSAVEAEAFPPPYSNTRVWSPGEYFYLGNAVYSTVTHTIGIAEADVPTSNHFLKVLDGAASRSDDIDARVAAEAEEGNPDPWPLLKIPTIPVSKVSGLSIPSLGISARTNSTIDLSHGSQTVTLPGAAPTEAGLLRGQDQAKLASLIRNRFVGAVSGPTNYLDGDIVYELAGQRVILAQATRDFQTGPSDRRPSNDTAGRWTIVLDFTLPTVPAIPVVPTTVQIVTAMEALTGDDRFDYDALKNKPILADPGTLHMHQRFDGRVAYGFGGEEQVSSDDDGTVIRGTGDPGIPFTPFHNRHDWVQGVTFYPENLVKHNNARYICLVEHVSSASNAPGTGVGASTFWEAW